MFWQNVQNDWKFEEIQILISGWGSVQRNLGAIFTCASPDSSAVECGSEMLELDCHMTLDGHVVVSHDENLLRQTGHDVNVSSLKLQVRGRLLPGPWRTCERWATSDPPFHSHLRQFHLTVQKKKSNAESIFTLPWDVKATFLRQCAL